MGIMTPCEMDEYYRRTTDILLPMSWELDRYLQECEQLVHPVTARTAL